MEAAIILPVALLLLFGTLELGRVMSLQQTLDNAAREGARWSAMPAPGTSILPASDVIVSRVQAYLAADGVDASQATINVNQEDDIVEGGLDTYFSAVDVTYKYSFATPLLSALIPNLSLTGHAVMRNETN